MVACPWPGNGGVSLSLSMIIPYTFDQSWHWLWGWDVCGRHIASLMKMVAVHPVQLYKHRNVCWLSQWQMHGWMDSVQIESPARWWWWSAQATTDFAFTVNLETCVHEIAARWGTLYWERGTEKPLLCSVGGGNSKCTHKLILPSSSTAPSSPHS